MATTRSHVDLSLASGPGRSGVLWAPWSPSIVRTTERWVTGLAAHGRTEWGPRMRREPQLVWLAVDAFSFERGADGRRVVARHAGPPLMLVAGDWCSTRLWRNAPT